MDPKPISFNPNSNLQILSIQKFQGGGTGWNTIIDYLAFLQICQYVIYGQYTQMST